MDASELFLVLFDKIKKPLAVNVERTQSRQLTPASVIYKCEQSTAGTNPTMEGVLEGSRPTAW